GNLTKLKKWKDNACQGVNALITEIADPSLISIETLDYPFSLIEPIVEEFDLSVCIDAGHQIKFGYDLEQTFEKQKHKTPLIHLHGVDFSTQAIKDHTSLDKLPEKQMKQIQMILKNFTGVVSLEVFNLENLNRSMASLSQIF
ncbi:MAG: sugar phosphate isomerase/epimerase, partial [Desulfobacteraceae bacterium]|nr:sugar phosphate isomerase/epimerase [Desulfobacteraceae bacterium]